jgi:hypothetical protein
LSLDQAAKVARYTPAEYDEAVCEFAQAATVAQIATATRKYDFDFWKRPDPKDDDDPGPLPDPEPRRDMNFGSDTAEWWVQARMPLDEGLVVEAALKASRDRLHRERRAAAKAAAEANGEIVDEDENGPLVSTDPVSWADALVGMARSVTSTDAIGAERSAASRVLVHLELGTPLMPQIELPDPFALHFGPTTLERALGLDSGAEDDGVLADPMANGRWVGSTHMGAPLPDSLRRLLTCDGTAKVVALVNGTPVESSRDVRIVPDKIRQLVEHRDRGCRVPGCDHRYWLQMHHITHWEDGGRTLVWNIITLCSRHHRLHHMGLLGIEGNAEDPDGITFTDHNGKVLQAAGRARPPTPADMPTVAPYQCPTGERLQKRWVTLSPTFPTPTTEPGAPGRMGRDRMEPEARDRPDTGDTQPGHRRPTDQPQNAPPCPDAPTGASTSDQFIPDAAEPSVAVGGGAAPPHRRPAAVQAFVRQWLTDNDLTLDDEILSN